MRNPEANPTGLNEYGLSRIARAIEDLGVAKARLDFVPLLTLSILAGAFIAFGAAAYTMVMTGADTVAGPARLLGGLAFSLGLILVIVGGAELFTGNALMVMAAVDRRITWAALLRNWSLVYVGNLLGGLGLAWVMSLTGLLEGPMGETASRIALGKIGLSPMEALSRGVLCNVLVCLAVWLSVAATTVEGRILAILWPISCFVLLGFEHSVANMYLIPQGWLAGASVPLEAFLANLALVSVGNLAGGIGGVAGAYWLAYRPSRER